MSGIRAGALVLAGRLLHYPSEGYLDDLHAFKELYTQLHTDGPADDLEAFVHDADGRLVEQLQEMFTQTFDMTPDCALEVGWHLFGEEYERGAFMVDMRQQLRQHHVPEGTELPDHLASLLTLVTKVDVTEAEALTAQALIPAVDKLTASLTKNASPFRAPLGAIRRVLAVGVPMSQEAHRG